MEIPCPAVRVIATVLPTGMPAATAAGCAAAKAAGCCAARNGPAAAGTVLMRRPALALHMGGRIC